MQCDRHQVNRARQREVDRWYRIDGTEALQQCGGAREWYLVDMLVALPLNAVVLGIQSLEGARSEVM